MTAAALYLESFGNALKFARTARRFAERKPLLALVGGRSRARLDRGHDGADGPGVGVDALLTQAGIIACPSGMTLCETALLLTEQPLPAGLRIGIVSNTGGLGTVAMDLVDDAGARRRRLLRRAARAAIVSAVVERGTPSTSGPT